MAARKLLPGVVYELAFECRDLGYGVEADVIRCYWTGAIDTWGKLTIEPVDVGDTLYLFRDEIVSFDRAC